MLVTASLHPIEAMDKLAAAHESAGDVERAESVVPAHVGLARGRWSVSGRGSAAKVVNAKGRQSF